MAPELRKRSKSTASTKEPIVKKTEKVTKRKAPEEASPVTVKKQKAVKEIASATKPAVKKTKKTTKKPSPEEPAEDIVTEETEVAVDEPEAAADDDKIEMEDDSASGSDDDEVDAEIQALAAGLDPEEDDGATGEGAVFKPGQDVGTIPEKLSKKEKKALAKQKGNTKEEPGVIYIGRLPHGFYEHELRSYFSQFGPVTKVRLSRNKRTGKSKHYAFIEFAAESTAIIAQKTMDKYLLFGHILTVQFVPKDKLHADIWKGANRRFKKTPWAKIMGNRLARPLTESGWEEKNSREEERRSKRADKLKAMGYEFEAPKLKQAPAPPPAALTEAGEDAVMADKEEAEKEPKQIEEVAAAAAVVEDATNGDAEEAVVVEKTKPVKGKAKKGKKSKA